MRLIGTIDSTQTDLKALDFSTFLTSQGIENSCEGIKEGEMTLYRIWIYDEEKVEEASHHFREYQTNRAYIKGAPKKILSSPEEIHVVRPRRKGVLSTAPYGPFSLILLAAVIFLFIWAQIQRGPVQPPNLPGVLPAPTLSTLEKQLIFDYPLYFEERDRLLELYTAQDREEKKSLSPEASQLLVQIHHTPVWLGLYDQLVIAYKNPEGGLVKGPLAEKIRQGEIWRLITPTFLHFDLLHIFFNVLWFILLGNQIEYRLGGFKYLLLIFATGILSNVAQYLMSGPFFMGLSGVICGMAAFIWARQQVAPWEGYLLHRLTLIFLAIFVLGMLALQTVFFFLQIFGNLQFTIGIANTAHLVGALIGYLLGRTRFFALNKPTSVRS